MNAAPGSSLLSSPESAAGGLDVIVIGGGQAGLSVGYHLARRGLRFVILDAQARVGDSWRKRWDSLRLFSPARYDGLDGMPFPAAPHYFPTKDEMADYLEAYAARFQLPVLTGVRVERVSRNGAGYLIEAGERRWQAAQVVVAIASYQRPRVPEFAAQLDPGIVQLHSQDYKGPAQLQPGPVLIAGAGNSGAEIALDLAGQHPLWVAGREVGHVPFRIEGFWARMILVQLVLRCVFHYLLSVKTPLGRKLRPKVLQQGGPTVRVKPCDLAAARVQRAPRVVGVRGGQPLLADGRVLEVRNVIWCTGFHPGFSWLDVPVLGEDGEPRHDAGVVRESPGLYFVGLHFLYAMSSTMIHGVGRDAARIADAVLAFHERCAAGRRSSGRGLARERGLLRATG
jgi:putative flavoprotein involved in K+ transport